MAAESAAKRVVWEGKPMECTASFTFPSPSDPRRASLETSIRATLFREDLCQLLWLKDSRAIQDRELWEKGYTLDYRVVAQAETLLKALAREYPDLQVCLRGEYDPLGRNLRKGYSDRGGFFRATLENGVVRTDDCPID
jgi:hypothetical protein